MKAGLQRFILSGTERTANKEGNGYDGATMNILTFLSAVVFDVDALSSESLCESSLYATSPSSMNELYIIRSLS